MHRLGIPTYLCFVLVFICRVPATGQETKKEDAAGQPQAAEESTHTVKRDGLKIEVNLTGHFEAAQSWPVVLRPNSWSSFTVVKAVPHGSQVKKGDQLVWLDTSKIDQQLQDLEHDAQLGKLNLRVAELETELLQKTVPLDLRAAERGRRIADEDLNYFMKTDRAFQIESAEQSLQSSRNSLEYAEEELKQLKEMYEADDLTEETEEIILKRARDDVDRAKFYLKSTQLRTKKSVEQGLPREEQQLIDAARRAEIAMSKATVSLPVQLQKQKIELEQQKLAARRTQEKLDELREDRKMMEIQAPADGYVYYGKWTRGSWSGVDSVASQLTEGGKLSPQNVFMTILNPRPLRIRVEVPEKELHRLSRGLQGKAVPDGFPELKLPTTLQQVSAFPIGKATFDAQFQVTLSDDAKRVVPGMGCKLQLVVYNNENALTVPAGAVFENEADGERNVVYVKQGDGQSEARQVVIGKKTEQKWEVLRGLREGDEILMKKPSGP